MSVETLRHFSVFDPKDTEDQKIDVIGVGATGSRIVLSLVKLGLTNIHIWDDDIVASHNIANQIFSNLDIGKKKVQALYKIIKKTLGVELIIHDTKVVGDEELGNVVFLLTDTMESRKIIFEKGLKMKPHVNLVIETRMGAETGRIYSFNPCHFRHIKEWEDTLYSDDDAVESLCGTQITVGPTAELVCGFAVWQFIHWVNRLAGKDEQELYNEIIFSTNPYVLLQRQF